jgi:murein DD-endopeptidase MepM/ murein hydrolase activator NlpD
LTLPALLAGVLLAASPPAITLSQGDLYRGTLPAGAHGLTLDGKAVATTADGRYIFGVGRDAAAEARLAWTLADGSIVSLPVHVTPRDWRIQSLPTLPPHPVPDAEFEARRPAEIAAITAARSVISDAKGWQGGFIRPAPGAVTGIYGSQRILAGTPSAPHAGLDFGAAAGTPVVAPAAGIVRLAAGPFTLEGNLVMVDHGMGLVSAFLHLSRIDVKAGDVVKQGQRLGAVGATGRATGPHLHWGTTWTDVRIDPARLLKPPPQSPPE